MKKQWFVLPLLLVLSGTAFAQTPAATAPAAPAAATNTPAMAETNATNAQPFAGTVAYTYSKDNVTYASPMALFEVKGSDDQSGLDRVFISVDNGEYAPYKGPVFFTTAGAHTMAYRFLDKVGNISSSHVMSVVIDAEAPRVLTPEFSPAVYSASGRQYVGLKNNISFKYFDDVTGVAFIEYSAGSATLARYAEPFTPESLGLTNSGAFVLNYQAVDMVSNVTALKKLNLYLDAAAPTVNVFAKVYEVDGIKYISPKDVISVEAFDVDTKVKEILYAVNEGQFTNYDPEIGIRITQPGEYDVKAKAIDIVGNTSAEVVFSVVVDAAPPVGNAAYAGNAAGASAMPVADEPAPAQPAVDPANVPAADTNTAAAPAGSEEVPAGTNAPVAE